MAVKTTGIRFDFTGDSSKAVAAWEKLSAAAKTSGGDLAAVGKQIEAALKSAQEASKVPTGFFDSARAGAAKRIEQVANNAGLGGVLEHFGGAEEALGKLSSKTVVAAGATAALGAVAVKVGVDSAQAYLATTQQVMVLANTLGTGAEQADKLIGAFRGLNVSTTIGTQAMSRFATYSRTNQKDLAQLGVAMAHTTDGGVDYYGSLLNVASAYQITTDAEKKAHIAQAAFGDGWREMVPLLEAGRAKLAELAGTGPGITDEDFKTAEKFKAEMAAVDTQVEHAKITIGRPLVGTGSFFLGKLQSEISGVKKLAGGDFSGAWDAFTGKIEHSSSVTHMAANEMLGLAQAGLTAAAAAREVAPAMVQASVAASNAAAGFAKLIDTQTTNVGATVRYRDAVGGLASVQATSSAGAAKYAAAQSAVGDAVAAAEKAAADGAQRIADAEEQASRRVVDAQESVARARLDAARASEDATSLFSR